MSVESYFIYYATEQAVNIHKQLILEKQWTNLIVFFFIFFFTYTALHDFISY